LFVKIEREGEDYRKTGQVSLLFPRQDTRRVEVRGGSVVAVASGAFNRELLIALDDLE
jgi:hypothetical protein